MIVSKIFELILSLLIWGVFITMVIDACNAYRGGELYAGALANNPSFVNLSDNGFSVLDGPSRVTHMK